MAEKMPIAIGNAASVKTENGGKFCIHRIGFVERGRQNSTAQGKASAMTNGIPNPIQKACCIWESPFCERLAIAGEAGLKGINLVSLSSRFRYHQFERRQVSISGTEPDPGAVDSSRFPFAPDRSSWTSGVSGG